MSVNVSKTKYIIFRAKGKKIENPPQILFDSNEINKPVNQDLIFPLERVFTENPNAENRYYKLLGCYFDEYLKFDKHVSYICAKLSRAIYCIRRVSNMLSLKALKSLYFALFHPHLLYCAIILSCSSNTNIKRILKLQKKVMRAIFKEKANAHTAPLFLHSNILPFDKILTYSKLTLMHAIHYKYAPKSFHNMFVSNHDRNLNYVLRNEHELQLPHVRIDSYKKFPPYSLPYEWNNLGIELQHQRNKVTFSILLKDYLFDMFSLESLVTPSEP
jgi:hypothetical protein